MGCDPCGQLLCGILQTPSAEHTLYSHSMAADRRSTGAYNTHIGTQWLGQHLCYSLVQLIGLWLFDSHSLETLLKAREVLLAHIDLSICTQRIQIYTGFGSWLLGECCKAEESIGLGLKPTKGIIRKVTINNFEVGWHLKKSVL